MHGFLDDLKIALRGLLRSPGVCLPAVATLAFGLGGAVLLGGVLDALLLRPPAGVREPGSLVRLDRTEVDVTPQARVSYPVFADLAGRVPGLSGLAAFTVFEGSLGRGTEARKARFGLVTPGYFSVLGVSPFRGRAFSPEEEDPRRPARVALVSHALWKRAFGGDEALVGRRLAVEGEEMTVVGILPPGFAGLDLEPVELWLPLGAGDACGLPAGWWDQRGTSFLEMVGRLQPGAPRALAEEQATAVHRQVYVALGDRQAATRGIALRPVQPGYDPGKTREARLAVGMAAIAGLLLALTSANVASLLLVRMYERRRELALRLTLGAGRLRLARFLVVESLLLALAGGAAATLLIGLGGGLVRSFLLPDAAPGALGLRGAAALLLTSLSAGLLAGLVQALWVGREGLSAVIHSAEHGGSRGSSRLRAAFLAAQVALTFVLLAGAGLFLGSVRNLTGLPIGMEPRQVFLATIEASGPAASEERMAALYRQALERARQLPGVAETSLTATIPFRSSLGTMLWVPGRGEVSSDIASGGLYYGAVTEGYFATLGTPVLSGRAFTAADGPAGENVVVVNRTLAQALWPGEDPLGRCLHLMDSTTPCRTVVGVVADARRQALDEPPTALLYLPLGQAPDLRARALLVRALGNPKALAAPLRSVLQGLESDLPLVDVRPLSDLLDRQLRPYRQGAVVLSVTGVLALGLAAVGLAAGVAQAAATRSREMGIRLALGGRPGELARRLLLSALLPLGVGLAAGWWATLLLSPALAPLLFGVAPGDPATLAAASGILLAVALAAGIAPALRVRRIDPAEAARSL